MASFIWPPQGGSGGGVTTYANLAAFPSAASAGNGALAIALDTNLLYESNGSSWVVIAGPGAASTPNQETFPLSGTNITNQYIDLAQVAIANSILVVVQGLPPLLAGASYDYSISLTGGSGGKTRITFLNDLATGGAAALVATDVMQVMYLY